MFTLASQMVLVLVAGYAWGIIGVTGTPLPTDPVTMIDREQCIE
ncbi:hypothetical protein [Caballeronia sp. RCC_10]